MRIVYCGPHDEVELPSLGDLACKRDETIDVPDEVGLELVKQDAWKSAPALSATRKSKE